MYYKFSVNAGPRVHYSKWSREKRLKLAKMVLNRKENMSARSLNAAGENMLILKISRNIWRKSEDRRELGKVTN